MLAGDKLLKLFFTAVSDERSFVTLTEGRQLVRPRQSRLHHRPRQVPHRYRRQRLLRRLHHLSRSHRLRAIHRRPQGLIFFSRFSAFRHFLNGDSMQHLGYVLLNLYCRNIFRDKTSWFICHLLQIGVTSSIMYLIVTFSVSIECRIFSLLWRGVD